jgi:hypothetical protein
MTDKEQKLLNSLYQFYSTEEKKPVAGNFEFSEGDNVIYNNMGERHAGEVGVYKGRRQEDGKIKIKYANVIFWANPKYVAPANTVKDLSRLYRILDQMVQDGDLSRSVVDKFKREVEQKTQRKKLDPYNEESWDDDEPEQIIKPPRPNPPQQRRQTADPCARGGYTRGGC